MVTIIDFAKRENLEGKEFFALILQGGIELVKAKETGNYYATAKKTSVTCTFDEAMCQSLIGKQIPGAVKRVECEPYELIDRNSGELIISTHRWVYFKEGETVEETVIAESEVAMPV